MPKKNNKKITDDYLKDLIVSSSDLYSKNLIKELEEYSKVTEEKPEALTRKVLIEKVSKTNKAIWEFTEKLNKKMNNNIIESTFLMLYGTSFFKKEIFNFPDITDNKEE